MIDLLTILQLDYTPKAICWVHRRGASVPLLAVSDEDKPVINIYDGSGGAQPPIHIITGLHKSAVRAIAYNNGYDCAISADDNGMIEYWSPGYSYEKPDSVFKFKSSTDLFAFKKSKSLPTSITISPSGSHFATFSFPDRQVRIFEFATGKLYRVYDESLTTITDMQQAGTAIQKLEDLEFGRRLAVERELENPTLQNKINVIFDESSNFIIYGSILGAKVINTFTNRVVKVYGKEEPFRSLHLTLYQGQPQKKGVMTVSMAASANPLLQEAEERDPMLVTTGSGNRSTSGTLNAAQNPPIRPASAQLAAGDGSSRDSDRSPARRPRRSPARPARWPARTPRRRPSPGRTAGERRGSGPG